MNIIRLDNELSVAKHCIREKRNCMKTTEVRFTGLVFMTEAFPATASLSKRAISLQVSSTTYEWSFSHMILIETYYRK